MHEFEFLVPLGHLIENAIETYAGYILTFMEGCS